MITLKLKYGIKSRLLFTDIDCLMYEIKTKDLYKDFSKDKDMFDFSSYSAKSNYYDASNKFVVGKMKDKTADFSIEEFVGLKPRLYSSSVNDSSEYKKAKGVNKNVITTISLNKFNYAFLWIINVFMHLTNGVETIE